jgi:CarD family transcriptional regulator
MDQDALTALLDHKVDMTNWIPDENRRKQQYRAIISSGDACAQLSMYRMLQQYQAQQGKIGKKIHICDDNFMRDVQKIISGEIAAVMQIPIKDATQYLAAFEE